MKKLSDNKEWEYRNKDCLETYMGLGGAKGDFVKNELIFNDKDKELTMKYRKVMYGIFEEKSKVYAYDFIIELANEIKNRCNSCKNVFK